MMEEKRVEIKMNKLKMMLSIMAVLALLACGGSGITTNDESESQTNLDEAIVSDCGSGSAALIVCDYILNLGQEFPADLDIPDLEGMRSTLFVTLANPPMVIPVEISESGFKISTQFKGLQPSGQNLGTGINSVFISSSQAFLMTDHRLLYFNPSTGALYQNFNLIDAISLNKPLPIDDPNEVIADDAVTGSFQPSFAADLLIHDGKIYVSFANLFFKNGKSYRVKGLVRIYELGSNGIVKSNPEYFEASGFNTTGLTLLQNDLLIVTNSGNMQVQAGGGVPSTDSVLDLFDLQSLNREDSLSLGRVGLNFRSLAVDETENFAYVGSFSNGVIYQIDLTDFELGQSFQVTTDELGSDFLTELLIQKNDLLVASFNSALLNQIDLDSSTLNLLNHIDFSIEANPGVTGLGPMVLRPGDAGVDFSGPDLFLVQGIPGILRAVKTYESLD